MPKAFAEEEGFEPPVPLPVHLISNQARSTAPPLLRTCNCGRKSKTNIAIRARKSSGALHLSPMATPDYITNTVTYEGNLRTRARHTRSGQEIITDAPTDNQGKGEAFSPTDLAATSLASCMITIAGIAAQQRDIDMAGTEATVVKVMDGPPRRISAVRIVITFPAKGYSVDERKVLAKALEACPVGRSLHPDLEQDVEVVWGDDVG